MKKIILKQWEIDRQGMYCPEKRYFIEKDRLHGVRPCTTDRADWPLHMADKGWVDIEDFIVAWQVAIHMHKVDVSHLDLAASFAEARQIKRDGKAFHAEMDRLFPRDPNAFGRIVTFAMFEAVEKSLSAKAA